MPKIIFGLTLALVFILAILPQYQTGSPTNDKIDHILAFLLLTVLALRAWPLATKQVAVLLAIFGLSIELVQGAWVTLGREASWLDWVADVVAIVTVCISYQALRLRRP